MIGIGTWEAAIDTLFYSGNVKLKVFDDNGKYGFYLLEPSIPTPEVNVISCEEDDTDINAVVQTPLLPGKNIDVSLSIFDDTISGFIKVPMLGKVKLKNGRKVD